MQNIKISFHNVIKLTYFFIVYHIKKNIEKYFDIKARYWYKQDISEIEKYWESRNDLKTKYIIKVIKRYKPKRILEIGCNCGNRLYAISKAILYAKLIGLDINELAVNKGNEWLKRENILNIKLINGRAEKLERFPNNSFDVVFTAATLIYIRPIKIIKVLNEFLRITKKYLILIEMNGIEIKRDPKGTGVYCLPGNWKRNYLSLFKRVSYKINKISISPIPEKIWSPSGGGASLIEVIK